MVVDLLVWFSDVLGGSLMDSVMWLEFFGGRKLFGILLSRMSEFIRKLIVVSSVI